MSSSRIIRIYNDDKTKHWSAVRVGDGRILEVKNPDGLACGYFDTEDAWATACIGTVETVADTHGFNYDWSRRPCCCWTNWLYDRMAELTPHLLANSDVRNAFNALVQFFMEQERNVIHRMRFGRHVMYGPWFYYSGYLADPPVHFPNGPFGAGPDSPWERLRQLWRPLRELLDDLSLALKKKEKEAWLKIHIKRLRSREWVARCRADQYARLWNDAKKELDAKEAELASLKK